MPLPKNTRPDRGQPGNDRPMTAHRVRHWVEETELQLRQILSDSEWEEYQFYKERAVSRARAVRHGQP